MFLNRLHKLRNLPPPNESSTGKAIRRLTGILVFICVVGAFWKSSEMQMKSIQQKSLEQIDATKTLTQDQLQHLHVFSKAFYKKYGAQCVVSISSIPIPPALPAKLPAESTVYIALAPNSKQVYIYAPPLIRLAVGDSFINHLQKQHFLPYFEQGNWVEGLAEALNSLTANLNAALSKSETKE